MKALPNHNFNLSPFWDEQGFIASHQNDAVTSIRLNPRKKTTQLWKDAESVPWCDDAIYLQERPVFTLDPTFHAGSYYVQEASSMFVSHVWKHAVTRTDNPLKVLDLCAAPGGKSTLLASLLREDDLLISNDVIQSRAAILSENMCRWGQMNTWVTNNDPKDFSSLKNYFDVVLIDAPCTGSGLWRKDEAAKDEWSKAHVQLCSERQKRIIADALPCIKDDGILIYATCSYSVEEDEAIADWLIDTYNTESIEIPIEENWGIVTTETTRHKAIGYRFYPWKLKGEGFFLACFRIKNKQNHSLQKPVKSKAQKGKENKAQWQTFLNTDFSIIEKNEWQIAVHPTHQQEYDYLSSVLKIRKTGTLLGKLLPKDVIPEHELALSIHLSNSILRIDVSKENALLFLKKETILNDAAIRGWHAVTYETNVLGWGKWLGKRMNNYLPKNWRIRMDIENYNY